MSALRRPQRVPLAAAGLGAALLLAGLQPASAEPAHGGALDRTLAEVDALLRDAHYHTAIAVAEAAGHDAEATPPALRPRASRLLVLVATAQVAVGEREAARGSLARALRLDPGLVLDRTNTSPKVLRELEDARPRLAGAQGP